MQKNRKFNKKKPPMTSKEIKQHFQPKFAVTEDNADILDMINIEADLELGSDKLNYVGRLKLIGEIVAATYQKTCTVTPEVFVTTAYYRNFCRKLANDPNALERFFKSVQHA